VVTATQTLVGLSDTDAGGFEPPDVQVAAGPGFVVEMVNLAERTWRTGSGPAQTAQTRLLSAFFGSSGDRLTDPRISYDGLSGRWFASISDLDKTSVLLAVSTGGDPTGTWTVSSYAAPGCADQPRLGLADGIVVLAADIFRNCDDNGSPAIGNEVWVVNKQELLDGSAKPDFTAIGPTASVTSLAPVQSLSPTATDYAVSVDEPTSRVVHLYAVDGIPPAAVTVNEVATPAITRLARPAPAVQPPTASGRPRPGLETNDDRVLDSLWENGKLWFTANTACTPAGDALLRACARIVELATASGSVTMDDNLSQTGAHLFYPALAPDGAGNLVIVYGESGTSVAPEVVAVGRTAAGAFTNPVVVGKSTGAYLGDRFGDYFGAARDPGSPGLVWVAGETGPPVAGARGWTTSVASIELTPAGAQLPPVLGSLPPRLRAVHVAARAGNLLRLRYRALDDAVGVRAVVTVRTTKVVFSSTTPALTFHAGTLYAVAWKAPAKLRGKTLGYCVHSLSSSSTPSQPSCTTVTLR
jgi:hypothetical protein